METDALEHIIKELKRAPVFNVSSLNPAVDFSQEAIQKIIPHRFPFLLVDKITTVDFENHLIKGERYISVDDPVFRGHFPENPIYPGVLQIEMMAQCGLCLSYFALNQTTQISPNDKPVRAMITKLHHAAFTAPVRPDQLLKIYAKIIDYDSMTGMIAGQIYNNHQLCSYSILEAYFND